MPDDRPLNEIPDKCPRCGASLHGTLIQSGFRVRCKSCKRFSIVYPLEMAQKAGRLTEWLANYGELLKEYEVEIRKKGP